jgi:hypothetical protein
MLYKQKIEEGNNNLGSEIDYYVRRDISYLQDSISKAEYDLIEFIGFEMLVDPIIPSKTQDISLIKNLIIITFFGLILIVFIVFFLDKFLVFFKSHQV